MPVYEYQGKHYDLSETDPSAAKTKIQSYLDKQEEPSQAASFGKSAFESLGEAAGGYGGAEAGLAGGAALGAMTGPFAPVAVPVLGLGGALVGGLTGGYLGGKGQELAGQYTPQSIKEAAGFSPQQRFKEKQTFPTTSTIGGLAPDILAGGKGLYDLTKLGIKSGKELASALMGKEAEKAQQSLAAQAEQTGKAGQQALTAEEAAAQKTAQAEQEKLLSKGLSEEEKKAQALKAGAKAQTSGEQALRNLTGVRTLPEAGGFKPIPQTASDVGNYIRQQAEKFVESIKSQRSKAADTNFAASKTEAAQKQALGQFVDTKPLIKTIDDLIAKGGSTDYLNSLNRLRTDLDRTKDFEGLEVLRRKLGDVAFGVPEEGYAAIEQGFAKEMYGSLAKQMKSYSDNFTKYLDDYKRLSKNLEAYGTRVGKGITKTEGAGGKYFAKTADQVANDVFRNPENYEKFLDAIGGNREFAESAARRYFAGLAENAKKSESVEKLLQDNRALLNKIPAVKNELTTRYLEPLRQAERRSKAAGEIVTGSKEAIANIGTKINEADKLLQKKLGNIKQSQTLFSDSINTLSSAVPGRAVRQFDETVLPKIRQAEQISGVKIVDESKLQQIRQQVIQLDQMANKAEKQLLATKILASLFGLGAGYELVKKGFELTGE